MKFKMKKISFKKILIAILHRLSVGMYACSLVLLIKLDFSDENWILFAVFADILVTTLCALVLMYGEMSDFYSVSSSILDGLQEKLVFLKQSQKYRRLRLRFYKSCPILKIMFGEFNFFDKITPPVAN